MPLETIAVDDRTGSTIDGYPLQELLDGGGSAAVYRSVHPRLACPVAVKLLAPALLADEHLLARFRDEARQAAELRHHHIARVFDFAASSEQAYLVEELLPGGSLAQRLAARRARGEQFSPREAIDLLRPLAAALDHAHRRGVVHGDVRPATILFNAESEPVLSGFGMAAARAQRQPSLTSAPYLAPEQARGRAPDPRTDVYALGAVLYELLTGRPPFVGESATAIVAALLLDVPAPPSMLRPDLPAALDPVVLRALARAPEERYPSAGALVEALATALGPPAPPAATPAPEPGPGPAVPAASRVPGAEMPAVAARAPADDHGPGPSRPPRRGVVETLGTAVGLAVTLFALLDRVAPALGFLRDPRASIAVVVFAFLLVLGSSGYVVARPRGFSLRQRRIAIGGLALVLLAGAAVVALNLLQPPPPQGTVVLIGEFDHGPVSTNVDYSRRIAEELADTIKDLGVQGVAIRRSGEVITAEDARARALAQNADVVVYGWYDDSGARATVELAKPPRLQVPLLGRVRAEVGGLDRVELRVGREVRDMTYVATAALGIAAYVDRRPEAALRLLDKALTLIPAEEPAPGREGIHFYRGAILLAQREADEAARALRASLALRSDLAYAHVALATAYMMGACEGAGGDPSGAAIAEAEAAARLEPRDITTLHLVGMVYGYAGRWNDAVAVYQAALQIRDDPATHALLADAYRQAGRSAEAEAEAAKAAAQPSAAPTPRPGTAEAESARGDQLYYGGQYAEAAAAYAAALAILKAATSPPTDPLVLALTADNLGLAHELAGQLPQAEAAYREAATLTPTRYVAQANLGRVLTKLGRPVEAAEAYERALALRPCDADLHTTVSSLYLQLGQSDQALAHLRSAAALAPPQGIVQLSLGTQFAALGYEEEARAAFTAAVAALEKEVKERPEQPNLQWALATAYLQLGRAAEAVPVYQGYLAAKPEDASAHYWLAMALERSGRVADALPEYQRAVDLAPESALYREALGDAYFAQRRWAEAVAAYEPLAQQGAGSPALPASLATAYLALGRVADATTLLEASLARAPDDAGLHFLLAHALEQSGRPADALPHYQRAAALAPNNTLYQAAVSRLLGTPTPTVAPSPGPG